MNAIQGLPLADGNVYLPARPLALLQFGETMQMTDDSSKYTHLFVSGPPRSGTTLLQLILSSHPMITVTPETNFIRQLFDMKFALHKRLSQDEMEFVIRLIRSDAQLSSWPKFSLDDFLKQIPIHRGVTVAQLLDHLFRVFAEQTNGGTDYLGNKKGLYAEGYGPYTKKVFPDAKFVYIVRDPRDVTQSILMNLSVSSLVQAALTCFHRDRHMAKMMRVFPDDTLMVRYENLVSESERSCQRICSFLGVPFDERMLTFYEMNRDGSRLIGVTKHIHQHTTTRFNPALIGQWKKKKCFTTEELQMVEVITSDYMRRYGYEPEAPSGGIVAMVIRLKVLPEFYYWWLRREMRRRMGKYIMKVSVALDRWW